MSDFKVGDHVRTLATNYVWPGHQVVGVITAIEVSCGKFPYDFKPDPDQGLDWLLLGDTAATPLAEDELEGVES